MARLEAVLQAIADEAAAPDGSPQETLGRVQTLLEAANRLDDGMRNRVLQRLAGIIEQTDGPRASALALGCGALVEAGGEPDIALGPVLDHLPAMLASAAVFYRACEEADAANPEEEEDGEEGEEEEDGSCVDRFGYEVSQRLPEEGLAWVSLEPMGLGAIAMLSRSPQGRRVVRGNGPLRKRVLELAGAHPRMTFLAKLLQVLDDEELLVLHPGQQRGYRVEISGIADNFQLHTLLAGALIGEPAEGWLRGKRPDPRVVAAARDQPVHSRARTAEGAFNLWTWHGLRPDGTLPEPQEASEHWIWNEGIPADIPPFDGVRVVLLGPVPYARTWNADRCFDGLHARLRIHETLSAAAVRDWLRRIATAPR
jgi:hypothetical protein